MKLRALIVMILVLLLNGCRAQATPSIDSTYTQAFTVAATNTMVAITQGMIQTETPVPLVTETPLLSPTPVSSPTLDPLAELTSTVAPGVTSQSGDGNCKHALDVGSAGRTHSTLIKNETAGTISISLNLYKPNSYGQCGYLGFSNMHKNSSATADLPSGYWSAYAWANGKGTSFTIGGSFFVQPAQFDKLEICIRSDRIVYKPAC